MTSSTGLGAADGAIPAVVGQYLDAHDRRDTDAALSMFRAEARVVDDGHVYVGSDEIRSWLAKASTEFSYTRTLLGAEAEGPSTWLVRNRLDGDFPGRTVELRYRFTLTSDRIAELIIAP